MFRSAAQRNVDAAAMAGTGGIPFYNSSDDSSKTIGLATDLNSSNVAFGQDAGVQASDITFVEYNPPDTITLNPPNTLANGVQVTKTYPLDLFFPFFGSKSIDVTTTATAIIRWCPNFPLALFDCKTTVPGDGQCSSQIYNFTQNVDPTDNSAITTYFDTSTSASDVKALVDNPPPCFSTPNLPINLNNGQAAAVLKEAQDQFNIKKTFNPPVLGLSWAVLVPIISCADLKNGVANQSAGVVGFAKLCITKVINTTKEKRIEASVCGGFLTFPQVVLVR